MTECLVSTIAFWQKDAAPLAKARDDPSQQPPVGELLCVHLTGAGRGGLRMTADGGAPLCVSHRPRQGDPSQ
jgi:hypothetical protein